MPISLWPPPVHKSDVAAGNDKTLTVPADQTWRVLWGYTRLTTSGTGGNREVRFELTNVAGPLWRAQAFDTQAASAVEDYHFSAAIAEPVSTRAGQHYLPMPLECLLKEGDSIRVYDFADIDAAGDVIHVEFVVQEFQE